MGCSYEIKENLPTVIHDKQTGRRLIETWLFYFVGAKDSMQSRSIEHSRSLAISFCSILMIFYLPAKVQTIIENTPLFDIFLPQNIKIYSLLGQNGVKK